MLIFVLQTLAQILAGGTSLISTEQIDFSHPSNRKEEAAGPAFNLYLYDVRESEKMQYSCRQVERSFTPGFRTTSVRWNPIWFDVSMLLTAWDRTTLGECHMISEAIAVLLRHRLLREEFLVPELRGYGGLNMRVSSEQPIEIGSLWSSLTIPLRPAVYVMLTVPFVPQKSPVGIVLERVFQTKHQFGNGTTETITKRVVMAGVVKSTITNQPLEEVEIKLMGTQKSSSTNKEGLFYFENLQLGNYVLLLNSEGYLPQQVNMLVDTQDLNLKEILLDPV
ncbi:Pvc16 family protein [Rivularia sp. UHCC 0363]|uniref:Pvc16 family protein n=1 Tax=Rivularia sp. UHCC 0363 TaxID=3110244 RepID=UPI002B1FF866|nr:Pvc16 family protein [Rivularia sp. UHCC 0363]MEA5598422.1 Pvc16 family protein [Rivularia sp. UHCC 0363]